MIFSRDTWHDTLHLEPDELEAIERRQAIYGGSFDTNVFELKLVDGRELHNHLANQRLAPAASREQLVDQPRPLDLMPEPLRAENWLCPLAANGEELYVLVHPDAVDERLEVLQLRFAKLRFVIAAECIFIRVSAQVSGRTCPARYLRLSNRYLDDLAQAPQSAEQATLRENARLNQLWRETLPKLTDEATSLPAALVSATETLTKVAVVFEVSNRGLLPVAASPHAEIAWGHLLALNATLARGLLGERMIDSSADLDLRLAVGRERATPCIFAPIVIARKPIYVLYADRDGDTFPEDEIELLVDLCGRIGLALEDLLGAPAAKKLGAEINLDTWPTSQTPVTEQASPAKTWLYLPPGHASQTAATRQRSITSTTPADLEFFPHADMVPVPTSAGGGVSANHFAQPQVSDEVGLLLRRLEDPDPRFRCEAAARFHDLRDARCVWPLAKLAFDSEYDVRTFAMQVLETYRQSDGFIHATAEIRRGLWARQIETREHAIRAAGILRDTLAVARLIDELDDELANLQAAALQALCSITGQQLGRRSDRWRTWYQAHGQQSRRQWLDAAAQHPLPAVRDWAHEEIARVGTSYADQFDPADQQRSSLGNLSASSHDLD